MKQENIKYNVYKIKRNKKTLESILNNYKEEIDNINSEIEKSIKYLEELTKNNS